MESTDDRKSILHAWIAQTFDPAPVSVVQMTGDASFRSYYRLTLPSFQTVVLMDAPPALEKTTASFIAVADLLRANGVHTPQILAADLAQGFLVLTDFGDQTYLKSLNARNADHLYGKALDALAIIQGCRPAQGWVVPPFSRELMMQEWVWHQEWFLGKLLGFSCTPHLSALTACYERLVDSALQQPQVFMHRDYHSANLMCLPQDEVGVLDFQDAFIGPVTYDLASLLRDCYIDWPPEQVSRLAATYLDRLQQQGIFVRISEAQFLKWFDWMGIQRHLKALFTFARKAVRDQQLNYLSHVPRTLNYLINVTQAYPELTPLHELFKYEGRDRVYALQQAQEVL